MECESQIMLAICNCVLYYMPKNKTSRVCGKGDAKCYSNIKKLTMQSNSNVCDECLPACTEISYSETMTSAPVSKALIAELTEELNKTPEYFIENIVIAHFYFEDSSFIRYTKGEIFGLTEFLSNTGGLLGLCMGFSMMSAVELVYYLTLRAFCSLRRNQTNLAYKP